MSNSPQSKEKSPEKSESANKPSVGQIVLVLQGGGALGAYQLGIYEALHEAGLEPDWVIGTSIGAINAALIAGNPVEQRMSRLEEFWRRVERGPLANILSSVPGFGGLAANFATITTGLPAFFAPNPWAFAGAFAPLDPERAAYYSVEPLKRTLADLVDVEALNAGAPRITVGAASVASGEMRYFDSRDERLELCHILASGALPPAFPAVRIDGELYWDGGILSNTPIEAVFDDRPRRNSLVFAAHIWGPRGSEPNCIWQVMSRQKDVQYSSRTQSHIARQKQMHRLRHIINELAAHLPAEELKSDRVALLKSYGCVTTMHVVRLVAPQIEGEDHTKDIDFSREGIRKRRLAGLDHTRRVLDKAPWNGVFDPMEGFILHEVECGDVTKSE